MSRVEGGLEKRGQYKKPWRNRPSWLVLENNSRPLKMKKTAVVYNFWKQLTFLLKSHQLTITFLYCFLINTVPFPWFTGLLISSCLVLCLQNGFLYPVCMFVCNCRMTLMCSVIKMLPAEWPQLTQWLHPWVIVLLDKKTFLCLQIQNGMRSGLMYF